MIMFRDFAKRKAEELGISGWVKNLRDDSVQLLAQGQKEKLEKYLELLKKGPVLAKVQSVETSWREPAEEFHSFNIVY